MNRPERIDRDHGILDSKGRKVGGYAVIEPAAEGHYVRTFATRDGAQFGAAFPAGTACKGDLAAARALANKKLAAQGARQRKAHVAPAAAAPAPTLADRIVGPSTTLGTKAVKAPAPKAAAPAPARPVKTYDKLDKAARAYAKRTGEVKGSQGGWIYTAKTGRAVCQGWHTYGGMLIAAGLIKREGDLRSRSFSLTGLTAEPTKPAEEPVAPPVNRITNMTVVRFQANVRGPWRIGVVTQDDRHLGFYWVRPLGRHRETSQLPAGPSIRVPADMVRYHREWSSNGAAGLAPPVPRKRGRPVDPNARRERTLVRSTPEELAAWTAAAEAADTPLHTWLWEVANAAARGGR